MIVSHFPHGPTVFFTLHNVNLRHDIASYKESTVSEQYPHLIFENFSSKLGERIRDVLKYLFPVPKEDSKRVMTFSNEDDFISFRCVQSPGLSRTVINCVGYKASRLRQDTTKASPTGRSWPPV